MLVEEWLLTGAGTLDLEAAQPVGAFWSRMPASSHTRGHVLAREHTRAVLAWLEGHVRRVVNGRCVLELEMSKIQRYAALRAEGDVPRTVAVLGTDGLRQAARQLPAPFVTSSSARTTSRRAWPRSSASCAATASRSRASSASSPPTAGP